MSLDLNGSQVSRGTQEADGEREDRRMEMIGCEHDTLESLSFLKPSWDISTCTILMSSTNLSQTKGIQRTLDSPTIPNKRN